MKLKTLQLWDVLRPSFKQIARIQATVLVYAQVTLQSSLGTLPSRESLQLAMYRFVNISVCTLRQPQSLRPNSLVLAPYPKTISSSIFPAPPIRPGSTFRPSLRPFFIPASFGISLFAPLPGTSLIPLLSLAGLTYGASCGSKCIGASVFGFGLWGMGI